VIRDSHFRSVLLRTAQIAIKVLAAVADRLDSNGS